jgi:predicted phage tail protein
MTISGAKGGGSSFAQTPDNLRSIDTFEGLLGLCVGPIKGPVRGLKSIKINDTAIENETGELNFGEFIATFADGDPTKFPQKVELKLGAGASPIPVQVALTNTNTGAGIGTPGPWVTKTVSNTGANFLDIRLVVQQLWRQDKKGIYNETATIEIQMKPTAATIWINPTITTPTGTYDEQGGTKADKHRRYIPQEKFNLDGSWATPTANFPITGKTTSPTVFEIRISVPNTEAYAATGWDVRCRLLQRDTYDNGSEEDNQQEKRSVSWESVSAVYSGELGDHDDWQGLSWLQLYGKASDQLNGVPEVTGEYDTKIVPVPPSGVYNPDTRQYIPGVWDGSWAYAFTTDPAWIIADAISDPLSGLSVIATGSYLNKWDALEASKWFSELVSDGASGTHPRYSLNLAISDTQKAEDLIRYMAGAVGALVWDQGNGEWRMKVDKPDDPVDIFTLDTIEGEFVYNHTDVDTRYNDVIGKFKNAAMDYREDSVRLFDNDSIAQIGRKPTTIALVGCTNRQEALRRIKLRLRSAVNETRVVNFTTNRRGRNVNMLDTILVVDGDLGDSDQQTNGRVAAISADRQTITLRDPVYLAPSVSYTLKYAAPNPDYDPETTSEPTSAEWRKPTIVETKSVTNTGAEVGSTRTLHLSSALPADVASNLAVALDATGLVTLPKLYRVLNVSVADDGERISIGAVEVDTGKWAAADAVSPQDSVFQDLRGIVPPPLEPEFGDPISLHRTLTPTGVITTLLAQWERPPSSAVNGFRVRHGINGDPMTVVVDRTQVPTWELVSPPPGIHHIEVCSIGRNGSYSTPLSASLLVSSGPDETRTSLGALWQSGGALVLAFPYEKGDIITDQGAAWIYISDAAWDGSTGPPDLPVQENTYWRQIKDATASTLTTAPTTVSVKTDYLYAPIGGELPRLGQARFLVGAADVTAATTWSISTAVGCTVSINSTGGWNITATTGVNPYFEVTGVYSGTTLVRRVPITTIPGDPPPGSGGGSGSSGATISSGFPTIGISGTYPTDPVPIGTVQSSSTGKLEFSATFWYSIDWPTTSAIKNSYLSGKLVYRAGTSGSWTDVASETTGSEAYAESDGIDFGGTSGYDGDLNIAPVTVTGLTASTDYQFGIKLRRSSGNAAHTYPSGSITALQVT